jgi:hypothetical protein
MIKYHKIFYDNILNDRETIYLNVYQNFLMVSLKFHYYVKGLHNLYKRNEHFEIGNKIYNVYILILKPFLLIEFFNYYRSCL